MKKTNAFIISLITIFIFGAVSANAATWTVTKAANSDDGVCDNDCSLREAVAVSNSGDLIVFSPNLIGQTFTLGGSPIAYVGKRIEIDGNLDGVNVAFISGSNNTYHFDVRDGGSLTLKNTILVNGSGGRGSILMFNANLSLDRVSIRNNTSAVIGAIELVASGTRRSHVITNSSITSNTTTGGGGAQIAAIHVDPNSDLYMSNTTISNNRTLGDTLPNIDFGAIYSSGRLFLRNCTITENEGNRGGGITLTGASSQNIFDVGNSIIAENSAVNGGDDIYFFNNPDTNVISRGGNLIGDTDTIPGGIFVQTNDAVNLNPLLAPTNSNQGGHPIFTHPLQAGSPARNTGRNAFAVEPLSGLPLQNDGRGTGFPRNFGGTVDKGAFETLVPTAGTTTVSGKVLNGKSGVPNAKVYITGQNGVQKTVTTNSLGQYGFDEIEVGQTYIISATSKLYQFDSKVVNVMDEIADADIIAN